MTKIDIRLLMSYPVLVKIAERINELIDIEENMKSKPAIYKTRDIDYISDLIRTNKKVLDGYRLHNRI